MSDGRYDWKIVARPSGSPPDYEGPLTFGYLPDRESAIIDAEFYAELIARSGLMPPSFEAHPANLIPTALVKRSGKASWRIRSDCWEHETETGYDEGYGYLRVERSYDE